MSLPQRIIEEEMPPRSMSLDEIIHEFATLDHQVREASARKRELATMLADKAQEERRLQNTIHLRSTAGEKVKVEFRSDYEYDNAQLLTAAELLGKDGFDELFKSEIKFTAKKRNLKAFLSTVYTDERRKTAKDIICDAVRETQKTPFVSVEKEK